MGDLNLRDCLIYLDDIIIFSSTFEEHFQHMQAVFENLEKHNLKSKPSKCEFLKERVVYLGHQVSAEGIHVDPTKAKSVIYWPVPKCTKDVMKFLESSGYYRSFVEGYATIARPLNDLLVGHLTNPEARNKKSAKPTPFVWGEDQQKKFEMIIDLLTSTPVFGYDAYQLPFILHTDVSGTDLGAALCQTQEDGNRVIAYASIA